MLKIMTRLNDSFELTVCKLQINCEAAEGFKHGEEERMAV